MRIRYLPVVGVAFLAAALVSLASSAAPQASQSIAEGIVADAAAGTRAPQEITYYNRVAHIVQDKCQSCHRPTGVGPFPMMSYEHVLGRRDMIKWVLADGIMPPWYAEPGYGPFSNDFSLSKEELADFLAWIDNGTPEGNPADAPEPAEWVDGWTLSKQPDHIITIPEPIEIPADGVVDYIYVYTKTNLPEDRWVKEVEIRPSARQATHHVEIFLESPEVLERMRAAKTREERRAIGREFAGGLRTFFAATVPGQPATKFPEGTGKLLPAGAWIKFQLHYTPNGREAVDRTEVGFVFADGPMDTELRTNSAFNTEFLIPAGAKDYAISGEYAFDEPAALLSFMPHTHLRGTRFLYALVYPDGRVETLLPVIRYDFNWQLNYFLETPIEVPAGSRLRATGWFDNSADNPSNPDPTREVPFGEQTSDEMMIGWFNWVERS